MLGALPASVAALDEMRRGANGLEAAIDALGRNDTREASEVAAASAASFSRTLDELGSRWTMGARLVPGVRRHLMVGQALARAGLEAARASAAVAEVLDVAPKGGWRLDRGSVDLEAWRRARAAQRLVVDALTSARTALESAPGSWLTGWVSERRAEAVRRVARAEASARRALAGLETANRLLGGEGDRRYLVLVADPSTSRGTGGLWRHFFVVSASRGDAELLGSPAGDPSLFPSPLEADRIPPWFREAYGRYGALRSWGTLNMSTDFPTVAEIARSAARASAGTLDGVVQVTPSGLAALLRLSGPVVVEEWPTAVGAEEVEEILSRAEGATRASLIGAASRATIARLLESDITLDARALRMLGEAVEGGHILLHSADPRDEDPLRRLGLSGALGRTERATDIVGVITSDATGAGSDASLRRRLTYSVSLQPTTGLAYGRLEVTLRNTGAGVARQAVVLLRPAQDRAPTLEIGGRVVQPSRDREADLIAYHTDVVVPAGTDVTLRANFALPDAISGSGRSRSYRLHLLTQPLSEPPPVDVSIEPLRGWQVRGDAPTRRTESRDVVITIELRQPVLSWVADTLLFRPWRALHSRLP